jgi:hypothetical protein
MVKFVRAIKAFFQAVSRMDSAEKIKLSDRLYLRIPDTRLTLVSVGADGVETMKLSVDETMQLFESIRSALETRDIKEIKVGELSWKTDARIRSSDQDHMRIRFNSPMGSTSWPVERGEVAAALADFEARYGSIATLSSSPGLSR